MVLDTTYKHVRLESLIFSHIDNPELDEFLRQEIGKLWGMTDFSQAKKEICCTIDGALLKDGRNRIAWYGESTQAREIFHDIVEKYKHEDIEWFLIVERLNLLGEQLPVNKILLTDWHGEDFKLTINMARECPVSFDSFHESSEEGFLSPFSNKECLSRAWGANLEAVQEFVVKINKEAKKNKVVVFVALRYGNVPSIEHIAKALNQLSGVKVYGVYLESDAPDDVYEDVFLCNYSLGLLAELLYRLPSVMVYLQAHASWSYLGQFVNAVNKDLGVIQEVYDWMGAYIADESLFIHEGVFSPKQISLMRQSEDCICNYSDGYIYKDDGPWMKDRVRKSKSPSLKIYPCPPEIYFKSPVEPVDNNIIKLVYAGQISHKHQPRKIYGDMYYIPVIRDLTAQGLHVTVYNSVHHTRRHPVALYQEYLDEAKNSHLFEFKKGIAMPEILDELHGNYHFGLIAYFFEDDFQIGENHIKGTMASKLFTYIAAGIPVIISEQFEYMANIVKEEGLGVVVSRKDMKSLTELLEVIDYQKLLSNVASAQKKYSIDSQIPALKNILNV